ncbi:hypothetical protein JJB99_06570 [Bradyrhizobium diazoefficiens]|uniref:hypothetical protein n=1 Tax=Bradyrhizobium diazoefficiens TaxID=1355477 RepID=UPI00190A9E96|nr:hypothetical protein [Bradyrhizobium diazoefficiens]QQO15822.1 hypothetical protein JJB99_06570 [Bradyrhizobium diazoefficiens]
MLENEPLVFPARQRYVMDPGISNRQLWAIGMVVVQWSHAEWYIDMNTHHLMNQDKDLLEQYRKIRGFKQSLAFWVTLIELKTHDPYRAYMLGLVPRIQNLNTQRDEVIHRLWGGGMERHSPSAAGLETTDAGLLPNPGENRKTNVRDGLIPFTWHATFDRLRRLATEIAELNRDLLQSMLFDSAPHGYVDIDGQVRPRTR